MYGNPLNKTDVVIKQSGKKMQKRKQSDEYYDFCCFILSSL